MTEIDPGHYFALDLLDAGENAITAIRFVKRAGVRYPGNQGACPGTNMQEVLRALIARIKYLDKQDGCVENRQILRHLRDCIRLLEERAARRHKRRPDWRLYESHSPETNDQIEHLPTCWRCGHIGCSGGCSRWTMASVPPQANKT